MNIQVTSKFHEQVNAVILPFFKDEVDFSHISTRSGMKTKPDFDGKSNELLTLYHPTKSKKIYLVGLGKQAKLNQASTIFRKMISNIYEKLGAKVLLDMDHLPVEASYQAAIGIGLATYQMGDWKSAQNGKEKIAKLKVQIHQTDTKAKAIVKEANLTADTQVAMMKLVNSPANIKTPEFIAAYAKKSGKTNGFAVKAMNKKAIEKAGLHALIAVGKGSVNEPVFLQIEYKSPKVKTKKPKYGLVGKGITFDSGGVSLKPPSNMHYMKSDMGGAAAVLGAVELAAKLKLNTHIVGIIPLAENSVDSHSYRPSDVIQSHAGKTIEIIDTDAEGRLVLADGLSFIQKKYAPENILDLATLTGSVVRTLGDTAAGMFTHSDDLADQLTQIGQRIHERVWRLPLWEDWDKDLHSDIADIRNYSGKPIGGSINGAKFLEFFVEDRSNWVHLDIAGVAFSNNGFSKMKSATGFGIRLLVELIRGK